MLLVAVYSVEAQPQHALAVALLDEGDAQAREVRRRVREQSAVGKQRAFTRHFSRSRASCSAGPCGGSASPDDIGLAAASEMASHTSALAFHSRSFAQRLRLRLWRLLLLLWSLWSLSFRFRP